jgi:hypothetical protein
VRLKLIKPLVYPIRFVYACPSLSSTPTISGCFASLLRGLNPCQLRQYLTFMHFGPQPQRLSLIRMNKKETHGEWRARTVLFFIEQGSARSGRARYMNGRHYCGCKCDCRRRRRARLGFTSRQLAISTPTPHILQLKLWRRANNNDVHTSLSIYL